MMNLENGKPKIQPRSFQLAVRVVKLCQHLEKCGDVSRTLSRQLLRSGTSVGANVQEAQAAQSTADFISKMNIALKEARETLYWLQLLVASDVVRESRLSKLMEETEEITCVIGAIVVTSRTNNKKP